MGAVRDALAPMITMVLYVAYGEHPVLLQFERHVMSAFTTCTRVMYSQYTQTQSIMSARAPHKALSTRIRVMTMTVSRVFKILLRSAFLASALQPRL